MQISQKKKLNKDQIQNKDINGGIYEANWIIKSVEDRT